MNAFARHNLREVAVALSLIAAAALAAKAYTDARATPAPCVVMAHALNFGCGR